MRPVRLTLEGFTSFRERTEIDFSQLDLFAITGPTGSGKTSILDAITWALYGKTARLGKASADLIHHGAARVSVILEFTSGMERYQIARTARRTGSPQLRLERFHDSWIPTDHSTASEINDAVAAIIGLDFDSFTRSVILPQGKFDAFLRGDAAERRKILKSLLGLEIYDRMRDAAVLRRTGFDAQIGAREDSLNRQFANVSEEHLAARKAQLKDTRKRQKQNLAACEQAQAVVALAADLHTRRADLRAHSQQHAAGELDHRRAVADAAKNSQEVGRLNQEIAATEKKLVLLEVDEPRYEHLLALNERAKRVAALETDYTRLRDEITALRQNIGDEARKLAAEREKVRSLEEARLQADRDLAAARLRLATQTAHGSADLITSFHRDLRNLPTQRLAQLQADRDQLASQHASLRAQIDHQNIALSAAEAEAREARTALDLLLHQNAHATLRATLKRGDPCPVCEQIVSKIPPVPAVTELNLATRRAELADRQRQAAAQTLATAQAQLDSFPTRQRELDERISDLSQSIQEVRRRAWAATGELDDHTCLSTLAANAQSIRTAEETVRASEQSLARAEQLARAAAHALQSLEAESARLSERLRAREDELARTRQELDPLAPEVAAAGGVQRIQTELAAAGIARQQRAALTQSIAALNQHRLQAMQLESAARQKAAALEERLRSASDSIAALNKTIAGLETAWTRATAAIDLPPGPDESARANALYQRTDSERTQLATAVILADIAVEEMKAKLASLATIQTELVQLRDQRAIYEHLATALRADRFIAYLLEAAYDDLCAKGSEHLRHLTQDRYSFSAGKSEFQVVDSFHGDAERSAATLSGGESFLASLALALALADSVATLGPEGVRTARLETLFIDEGVSSLDDETLSNVVEALAALQTGDRLVGIISHMENLAERLPSRLNIQKQKDQSKLV